MPSLLLSLEGAGHLRHVLTNPGESRKATYLLAADFCISLLFIILIPVKEAAYRFDSTPGGELKSCRLVIALTGLAMISIAGFFFIARLDTFLINHTVPNFLVSRNVANYLALAFLVLLLARIILPSRQVNAPGPLGLPRQPKAFSQT